MAEQGVVDYSHDSPAPADGCTDIHRPVSGPVHLHDLLKLQGAWARCDDMTRESVSFVVLLFGHITYHLRIDRYHEILLGKQLRKQVHFDIVLFETG